MSIPPTFQEAIAKSAEWIRLWDAGELSDEVLADEVGKLVCDRDGARGFFVVSLTGASPLMDRLPEPLVLRLRMIGSDVVDLTVRNLAMSSAMAVHHRRQQDQSMLEGSLKVQSRSRDLLAQLDPVLVKEKLERLLAGLKGDNEEKAFFERWGYDEEQRNSIELALLSVAD
ncbi:MAG: hypothetical protein VKO39_03740 [Cyanobacteriota bacterium]|nr:hypothetical protein [Cyanobacteriota bacterium]